MGGYKVFSLAGFKLSVSESTKKFLWLSAKRKITACQLLKPQRRGAAEFFFCLTCKLLNVSTQRIFL
jgi:hypothetical protein